MCDESPFWLNPKCGATMFYDLLSGNAGGFLGAMGDLRWPKSDRPTSQGRRDWSWRVPWRESRWGLAFVPPKICLAKTESEKLEMVYRPMCVCGHRERDHKDKGIVSTVFATTINIPVEGSWLRQSIMDETSAR